jgi:hypothetical protein
MVQNPQRHPGPTVVESGTKDLSVPVVHGHERSGFDARRGCRNHPAVDGRMVTEILELHPRREPTGRRCHRPHGFIAPPPGTVAGFLCLPAFLRPRIRFHCVSGIVLFLIGPGRRTLGGIGSAESRGVHSLHRKPLSGLTATAMPRHPLRDTPSQPARADCAIASPLPGFSPSFSGKSGMARFLMNCAWTSASITPQ